MSLHELMEYIKNMRKKGFTDYKIVESLISQGYKSKDIYKALTALDLGEQNLPDEKINVNEDTTRENSSYTENNEDKKTGLNLINNKINKKKVVDNNYNSNSSDTTVKNLEKKDNLSNIGIKESNKPKGTELSYSEKENNSVIDIKENNNNLKEIFSKKEQISPELLEKIQEISEAIIEEKWDELIENVKKIVNWKNRMEKEILDLKNRMEVIEKSMSDLRQGIFNKINSYDSTIKSFSIDLKALQKVFGEMLPEFVTGIHELKEILEKFKKE